MPITLNSLQASSLGSPGVGGEKLVFFRPPTLYPQRPPCCSVQHERGKVPGKRKRKGQEVEFLKGREAEEIWGNYPTMLNISQSKKGYNKEAKKTGAGDSRFGPPTLQSCFLNNPLSE